MQGVSNGQISGLGLNSKAKWITSIDYWLVGIPISCVCIFKLDMSLAGLWYGPTVACMLNYYFYERIINSADWQEIVDQTRDKLQKDKEKAE